MAGNTAYNGILVALDSLLEEKKKGRKDPGPQRRTVPGGDVV
ncbi:hypothetical protein [Spirosoma pollinicola]|nr:hypothetical protein [Spirosoma pollinicola]